MKNCPGYVFKRRHSHRAIELRKRQRLEAVIDQIANRLIEKGFVAVSDDGKRQTKPLRQVWPPTAN